VGRPFWRRCACVGGLASSRCASSVLRADDDATRVAASRAMRSLTPGRSDAGNGKRAQRVASNVRAQSLKISADAGTGQSQPRAAQACACCVPITAGHAAARLCVSARAPARPTRPLQSGVPLHRVRCRASPRVTSRSLVSRDRARKGVSEGAGVRVSASAARLTSTSARVPLPITASRKSGEMLRHWPGRASTALAHRGDRSDTP
jgi:hypothetical protein